MKVSRKKGKPFQKTRKEVRKEQRQQKKARKNDYYTNRNKIKEDEEESSKLATNKQIVKDKNAKTNTKKSKKKHLSDKDQYVKSIEKEKKEHKKLQDAMHKQRKEQLLEANVEEDRNIKQLESQLKLKKLKSKGIAKNFKADGLDYLLEVCDSENIKGIIESEQHLLEGDDDFEEDLALMTNQRQSETKADKSKGFLDSDEENSDLDEEMGEELDDEGDEEEDFEDDELEKALNEDSEEDFDESEAEEVELPKKRKNKGKQEEKIDKKKAKIESHDDFDEFDESDEDFDENDDEFNENNPDDEEGDENKGKKDVWEDIYGRLRDKQGNVINEQNEGKYIPPAIRAKMEANRPDKEKIMKLRRQLKGLMNRLAESNMHSIATQIEQLYMQNSRNDMNETLTNLILDVLVTPILSPERLLIEHILLITILHANVGTEVGAHFLQVIVKLFHERYENDANVEDKTLDNLINIIAQLYNFKVFNGQLLHEILIKLADKFEEKHVECILGVLKSVGFTLRRDDPIALKNLIVDLQKRANNASDLTKENARVKFMLEILLAIKNNNVNKIPNYDTTYSEHLKKILKNFIRKGNYVTQLNIKLDDLLKADERGKWWVVGSAWTGKTTDNENKTMEIKTSTFSQKLLDLARKQRMNTDNRRNIFCILMTAEDYLDAFEKLLHLGLKNQQEREIIHVLLHCCLQEKKYNPYYSVLAQKFCDYDRRFQMTIKCSIWDKLKTLTDCSALQISNLAKLLIHLFLENSLPISTLKILEFSELDKITLRFTRQILLGILIHDDLEKCQEVFSKVAFSDKLKMFRQSLRLFIHHFLLKNLKENALNEEQKQVLEERARMVERLLSANDAKSRFI